MRKLLDHFCSIKPFPNIVQLTSGDDLHHYGVIMHQKGVLACPERQLHLRKNKRDSFRPE